MQNDSLIEKPKSRRGGVRPGSGRPKGTVEPQTIERERAKTRFLSRVHRTADKLFNAQFQKAVGESFLMVKKSECNSKGTVIKTWHEIVEDPQTIIDYLDGNLDDSGGEYYYMSTRPADNAAIQGLLDRGFGKATEHVDQTGDMTLEIVTRKAGTHNTDDDN